MVLRSVSDLRSSPKFSRIPIISVAATSSFGTQHPHESYTDLGLNSTIDGKTRKQYEDGTDIDWVYEYDLYRRYNRERLATTSKLQRLIHTNTRWSILIISSCAIGILAIIMDYLSVIIHDWKFGACSDGFFVRQGQCQNWKSWSQIILPFMKPNSTFDIFNSFVVVVVLSLALGYIGISLALKSMFSSNNGVSEAKLIFSGTIINHLFDYQVIVSKIITLIVVSASGIWVGLDGPLTHISGGITDLLIRRIPYIHENEAIKRELLYPSVATGIAVAFNAPIGGVMFCLEQITSYFPAERLMWTCFVCATISVSILQTFRQIQISESFEVSKENNWIFIELLPFLLLGILGGILGIYFNRLNLYFATTRKQRYAKITDTKELAKMKTIEILVIVFLTVSISYFTAVSMPMFELLQSFFTDCSEKESSDALCKYKASDGFPFKFVFILLFTSIQAFVLSAYSFGCNIPGGVLTPILVIGASMGRLLGVLFQYFQTSFPRLDIFLNCNDNSQCISPASYAVVGAGSFFTGVTKMSVTSVIIQFELTGALTYVLPIMVGVLFSRFVNDLIAERSIYELWLLFSSQKNSFLLNNLDELSMPQLSIVKCEEMLKPLSELVVFYENEDTSLEQIENMISRQGRDEESAADNQIFYPILNDRNNQCLLGYITHFELNEEINKIKSEQVVSMRTFVSFTSSSFTTAKVSLNGLLNTNDLSVNGDVSLLTVYTIFDRLKFPVLFVYQIGQGNRLQGIVTKDDVAKSVNEASNFI